MKKYYCAIGLLLLDEMLEEGLKPRHPTWYSGDEKPSIGLKESIEDVITTYRDVLINQQAQVRDKWVANYPVCLLEVELPESQVEQTSCCLVTTSTIPVEAIKILSKNFIIEYGVV